MTRYVVRTLTGTLLDYPTAISTQANYLVRISGVEVFSIAGQLKVDRSIGKRSQATLMVHTDVNTHFQQYERILILDNNGNLIFNGYISQEQEQQVGFQQALIHSITAIDQRFLADKRIVAGIYTNKTCGAIVVDLQRKILSQEGVTIGAIYDGLLPSPTLYPSPSLFPNGNVGAIPSITFAYCTVSQALDQLATLASSGGTPYYWTIDPAKNLFFVPYSAFPNPNTVDGSTIWQDGSTDLCTVQRQNPKYRNVEWLTGGVSQTPLQTETFGGDGNRTSWTLNYQVASTPLVLVSTQGLGQNLQQIVGLKGTTGSEFYWAPGDATISQDTNQPKLQTTQTLKVIYTGQFPSVATTQNNPQIITQRQLDGTSGMIEAVDDDKNLTNSNSAILEASQLLAQYSVSGTLLTFTTLSPVYSPGDLITVNLPNHNLNNTQMLVETVSVTDQRDAYNMWYTVTAILGPYDNTWQAFFSKLLTTSHASDNITVGSSSTAPTSPTLVLYDAMMRFKLQTSGGSVHTSVFADAAMRFKLQTQTTGSTTQSFSMSPSVSITVTPTVTASGSGGGTYKTFSGPTSACKYSPAIVAYQTNSKQAIRFIKFGDNANTSTGNTNQYIYGTNILIYWNQIEPTENNFDWSSISSAASPWTSNGKKYIIRIMTCGQTTWHRPYSQQGTPQWVFDAGARHYSNDEGDVVPAYWDSVYLTKFEAMVKALAAQYDGDPNVEYVQVAVGMGGECKPDTHKATDTYTKLQSIGYTDTIWLSTCQKVIDIYKKYFTRTKLGIQTAAGFYTSGFSESQIVSYAVSKGLGLQNDGLGLGSNYIPPKSTWKSGAFIAAEQRLRTSQSSDPFECDIQAMISYCQTSEPIYLLCFVDDLTASGNQSILQNYASPF